MNDIRRPQPLGAFALPAGLLLVAGEGSDDAREALLVGRLPNPWPESLEGHRLAHEGEVTAAADWFAAHPSPANSYNLFVLDPERVDRATAAAALGPEWRPLVDYVAFSIGLTSVPPAAADADGELAALLLTAQAAAAVDAEEEDEAIELLERAAQAAEDAHPAFAGIVESELAARAHDLDAAERSVALLRGTELRAQYAEALYQRAGLIHGLAIEGRRPLNEAIRGYTEALDHLNERDHPALFARVHLNLGTAYLAAPLIDQNDNMRAAVAVQSLRTAVRILDPEQDAEEWASATLNLANALVYTPSTRQRDHLMEAVDLYETVVRVRTPKKDPLGRARVLANQGNALAHLGLVDDANARLAEAEFLFASNGDEGSAAMVRDVKGQLAELAS